MENRLFDTFWNAYPKKVAKQKAYRAFCKLSPDAETAGRMVLDVERRKRTEQWRKEGGQYIPYPATYINDRRWEDQVDVPAPPTAQAQEHSYNLDDFKGLVNKF